MEDRFKMMLEMQLKLQVERMKDGNPQHLVGDEMADFMRWNAWSCTCELVEAMQEVDWKPWTHNEVRTISEDAFLKEMVDAFHFFMNMLLCALPDSPEVIADKFATRYLEKNAINAQRQIQGYTGHHKCEQCARDLDEVARSSSGTGIWREGYNGMTLEFCSHECRNIFMEQINEGVKNASNVIS